MPELFDTPDDLDDWANLGSPEVTEAPAAVADTVPEEVTETPAQADTVQEQEAPQDGRRRNPDGTFAPKTAEEPSEAEQLLAGKYRTVEELEQAYKHAESRLGQSGNELGELRQALQELQDQLRPQEPVSPSITGSQFAAVEEWLEDNPHIVPSVATEAFESLKAGDPRAEDIMDVAVAAWRDVDRRAAERFSRQVAVWQARVASSQETREVSAAQLAQRQAIRSFKESHPDLDHLETKINEIAPQYPSLLPLLGSDDARVQMEVLDFLYTKAKAAAGDTLTATTREFAEQAAVEADRAIAEASVVSAGSATPPAVSKSDADILADQWAELKRPYEEGWPF